MGVFKQPRVYWIDSDVNGHRRRIGIEGQLAETLQGTRDVEQWERSKL